MKYKKLLEKYLLEAGAPLPSPGDPNGGNTHDVPDNAISGMLDQDTNPDSFLTQGIKDTFDKVQQHFDGKMSEFASTLSPEAAKTSTLGELKERVKKVYDFTNKVQVFAKAKIDSMAQDPYAIMAGFIASDPTKQASFAELHKTLEGFQKSFEELDTHLAGVNGKIKDFLDSGDGGSPTPPQAGGPQGMGAGPAPGGPSPAPSAGGPLGPRVG